MSLPNGDSKSTSTLFIKAAPLIFILLWAGGFTFAKLGLKSAAPFTLLNMRFFFASIAFYVLYLIFKPALPKTKKEWQHTITSGFLLQVIHFSCIYYAIVFGISAISVLILCDASASIETFFSKIWSRLKDPSVLRNAY